MSGAEQYMHTHASAHGSSQPGPLHCAKGSFGECILNAAGVVGKVLRRQRQLANLAPFACRPALGRPKASELREQFLSNKTRLSALATQTATLRLWSLLAGVKRMQQLCID